MIILDILIPVLLFSLSILIYALRKNKTRKFLIIDILLGVYYALFYLAWRFLANNYHIGSLFHIFVFSFAFIFPFIVSYYVNKNKRVAYIVTLVLCTAVALLILSRFITWPIVLNKSLWFALPLNICNIMGVLGIVSFLTKNKFLKNIFASIGLLGGAVTLMLAFNEGTNSILNYLSMDSYFLHFLLVAIPIYMIINNAVEFDYKMILKKAYIFPIYYLFCYFFNHFLGTNFLYTVPGGVGFLEMFYNNLPIYYVNGYEIALWYYLIVLVGGYFILVLLVYIESIIEKILKKKEKDKENSSIPN
ncbi:MAG: YwaF family protein [Acholeplasmatales bacterium]|jgi:uncharacterized membrane protein YwaF|nr:YwaF family protein [Acholeplasmatales bacterium]